MCIFCVPLTASYAFDKRGWVFGPRMCHFVTVMQSAAVYAAVLSLMAIAVDRYVVVAYPIRKRAGCQFCWGLVILIWLSSLALSTPTALHTVYLDLGAAGLHMAVCEEFWDGQERGRLIYSCFILFFSYFVPLAAVSISYCAISCLLKKRTTSGLIACPELRSARAAWSRRRRKTFCLLLVSVLCFAFSWLPLQVHLSSRSDGLIDVWKTVQHFQKKASSLLLCKTSPKVWGSASFLAAGSDTFLLDRHDTGLHRLLLAIISKAKIHEEIHCWINYHINNQSLLLLTWASLCRWWIWSGTWTQTFPSWGRIMWTSSRCRVTCLPWAPPATTLLYTPRYTTSSCPTCVAIFSPGGEG